MNIYNFKKVFKTLLRHNIVPYLHGAHGVGKTQVVGQCTKSLGSDYQFIPLYLATQEVGDLIGLLNKNEETGKSYHMVPEWFPTDPKSKGVIFLDEFNRAHPDVLQAMFPFVLTRKMHTHELPEGWHIVVAGNFNSNSYNTTDVSDSALVSRFCHINFKPTVEEFIDYAESKGADLIADFIRNNPEMLSKDRNSEFNDSIFEPNPRAYLDFIAPLENEEMDDGARFEIYCGIIGKVAATNLVTFKNKKEKTLTLDTILKNYNKVRPSILKIVSKNDEVRLDYLNQPLKEIETKLKTNPELFKNDSEQVMLNNFKQYLMDVPLELSLKVFKSFNSFNFYGKNSILNDKKLTDTLLANSK